MSVFRKVVSYAYLSSWRTNGTSISIGCVIFLGVRSDDGFLIQLRSYEWTIVNDCIYWNKFFCYCHSNDF